MKINRLALAGRNDVGVAENSIGLGDVVPRECLRISDELVCQFTDTLQRSRFDQCPVMRHDVRIVKSEPDRLAGANVDFPRLVGQVFGRLQFDSPSFFDWLPPRVRNSRGIQCNIGQHGVRGDCLFDWLVAREVPEIAAQPMHRDEQVVPTASRIADAIFVIGIHVQAKMQLVDGLQVLALGLLRGVQDTTVPMVMATVSYWVIGLPVSYVLAFPLGLGAVGLWLGLGLGLGLAALTLLSRFWGRSVQITPIEGLAK